MKQKAFNLMDYLTMRGDLTFSQSDFNSVDALILSQIVYNNIEGLVSKEFNQKITLAELAERFISTEDFEERCNMGAMINPLTPELLRLAAKSRRFSNVKVCAFINKIDEKALEQFCALTYQIEKDRYVIAFRGTDDTIVGWYEDFNLGYMPEIPAQKDTREYIARAMAALKGHFIFTGHSKGGNLSVFGGMSVPKKSLARLDAVYNFDGPGFFAPVYERPEYKQIKDRIFAFFPEFCVVGMMFEHVNQYKIVKCSADGILQHDPFSWNLMGPEFEAAEAFDEASEIFYTSFNAWANTMTDEERKKFIDSFFSVIYASGAKTNYEIDQNKIICGGKMLAKLAELSEEERKAFKKAIKVFIKVVKDEIPMFTVFKPLVITHH